MEPGITSYFAEWAHALNVSDIPDELHDMAHRAMLDTLGVMLAGGAHPTVQQLAGIWPATDGPCGLATGGHSASETAALINGAAAHFWDFDDTSYTGIMHGSAVVFPTVLALAQEIGASNEEARTAFIVGSEIAYALGDICTHQHYFRGWWSTVTFGLVGATAAAARLLGCNADQMAQAIGLAAAAAGGGKSVFGTHAKPYLVGETAQRSIGFARFVAGGMSGPRDGIEGEIGFLHLLNDDVQLTAKTDSLGKRWRLVDPGLLFKLNPVCSAAHAAIEEIARLTFHDGIAADDIRSIRVEVPKLVRISLVHDRPETPAQAQFSLPFAAACATFHGMVRLKDLNEIDISSTAMQALMTRVQIVEADDLSTWEALKKHPESARVTVTLNDHSERVGFCAEAYGMPGRPLSDDDFAGKFHDCLAYANCAAEITDIFQTAILPLASDLLGQITNTRPLNAVSKGGLNERPSN